jgi:hypothetical protein
MKPSINLVLIRQHAVGSFFAVVDGVEHVLYRTTTLEPSDMSEIVKRTETIFAKHGVERPARIGFEDKPYPIYYVEPEIKPYVPIEKLAAYIDDGKLVIQPSDYIEDGWYVVIEGMSSKLYEIPKGGGNPSLVKTFFTAMDAINAGKALT